MHTTFAFHTLDVFTNSRFPANTARARIFFPNGEIPFAGHPTVGCAILPATLPERRAGEEVTVLLEEEAGLVPVTVTHLDGVPRALFTAPAIPVEIPNDATDPRLVAQAVGLAPEDLGFGTHRRALEQGYEMGRPSDLHLEADIVAARLTAVRVAGQACT